MDMQYTEYDKKELFNEKMAPLIAEMKKICKLNKVPFFISVATANKRGETSYYTDGVMPGSNSIKLYDDQYRKYLLVIQGATVSVQKDESESIADYIASNMGDEDEDED